MELKPLFRDIAEAIRQKDGTADPITASSFPERIRELPSVILSASPKDVNFYDYDGTLVYSYTLAEAQALTALPKGPTHKELVFQGWNWSLEKIKALTRPMNVGAMYITDDGKTRLKIRVWDKARSNVPLYISQTVANGVTIDWGDGGAPETLDGAGKVNTSHQYSEVGDYVISLAVSEGCRLGLGSGKFCVFGSDNASNTVYRNLLYEANIGDGVEDITKLSFSYCYSMKSISMPDTVKSIGMSAFSSCYSLKGIVIPGSVTSIDAYFINSSYSLRSLSISDSAANIGSRAFLDCFSLSSITLPDGVTNIYEYTFQACNSLASMTLPDTVVKIGGRAFYRCLSMAEYHLRSPDPPELTNANAFEGIPSDCIIYVPKGSLEAYKTAENWSVYADRMREEESK